MLVQIYHNGSPPPALQGLPLQWQPEAATCRKRLVCGGFPIGWVDDRQLAAATPDDPLVVEIDWLAVARSLDAPCPT